MVNDIQKLHKVIAALEEQSTSVSEFNGVLSAVNSAKADICSTKAAFEEMAKEQKKLVSESYTRFEEYGTKLTVLESKLVAMEKNHSKALNEQGRKIDEQQKTQKTSFYLIIGLIILTLGLAYYHGF